MTQPIGNWLDQFIFGIRTILGGGVAVKERRNLNFIGVTVADNPTTLATDVTIGGGPPSGAAGGDLGGNYPNPEVDAVGSGGGLIVFADEVDWTGQLDAARTLGVTIKNALTTTDATPTVGANPAFVPFQSTGRVDVIAVAQDIAASPHDVMTVVGTALYRRAGAGCTLVDSSIGTPLGTTAGKLWTISFDVSGGDPVVKVTGASSTTVRWSLFTQTTIRIS